MKRPRRFEELDICLAVKLSRTSVGWPRIVTLTPRIGPTQLGRAVHAGRTDLGDRAYPGNKVCQYLLEKIKYMNYRRCMRQVRQQGFHLQHSFGVVGIFTEAEFLQAFWNIFPNVMQDWLTNDQNTNPFAPVAPLGVDKVADYFQSY